ncbi:MAG: PilX N-terminal domain-containing pilus assembly protein [Burkholderiales bacterium]|nr:PilX N-terminal domain-containing pilus assembly protein [Burkholderiales bacterium]
MRSYDPSPRCRQSGLSLIMGLLMLTLLSIVGLVVSGVSVQEGFMARNHQDRNHAFNAAEAALRHCEDLLASGTVPTGTQTHPTLGQASCSVQIVITAPGLGGNDSLAAGRPLNMGAGAYAVRAESAGRLPGTQVRLQSIFIPRS